MTKTKKECKNEFKMLTQSYRPFSRKMHLVVHLMWVMTVVTMNGSKSARKIMSEIHLGKMSLNRKRKRLNGPLLSLYNLFVSRSPRKRSRLNWSRWLLTSLAQNRTQSSSRICSNRLLSKWAESTSHSMTSSSTDKSARVLMPRSSSLPTSIQGSKSLSKCTPRPE
jgi:hypothetical protein